MADIVETTSGDLPGPEVGLPESVLLKEEPPESVLLKEEPEPLLIEIRPGPVGFNNDWFVESGMISEQERREALNTETARTYKENGQDPSIAFDKDSPPHTADDGPMVLETDLLNPESDKGKTWLLGAKIWHDYAIGERAEPATDAPDLPTDGSPEIVSPYLERKIKPDIYRVGRSFKDRSDEEISEAALEHIGHTYWNLLYQGDVWAAAESGRMPPEVALAQAGLLQAYEELPSLTFSGSWRALKGIGLDPTTWVGGLAGLKITRRLLAAGGKKGVTLALRDRLMRTALGSGFVSTEAAIYASTSEYMRQNLSFVPTAESPEFVPDWDKIKMAAAGGAVIGWALPMVISNVPGAYRGLRSWWRKINTEPPAMSHAEALADTRASGDIVAERLKVLVPPEARTRAGGEYVPDHPDGRSWDELSPGELAAIGPGFRGTDDDLQRYLDDALGESSAAAKAAAEETGFHLTLTAGDWDAALKLPLRAQLWYELSGTGFIKRIPILAKSKDAFVTFTDVLGVTSPREKPLDNLRRALAVISQKLRGEPIDVDLINPAGVGEALARETERIATPRLGRLGMPTGTSVASGNKTGNFSDTIAMVGGADVPPPIPVNDVWVGKIFGVTEEQLMNNQSLHEPMALFWNKLRDHVNKTSPEGFLQHESWQLQSRSWVKIRGAQDDYAQGMDTIVEQLREAGIPGITADGKITEAAFLDPRFTTILRPTVAPFREAAKATVEVGTTLTPAGQTAADLAGQLRDWRSRGGRAAGARGDIDDDPGAARLLDEYNKIHTSALYHSGRGRKNMWEQTYNYVMGLPAGQRLTRIKMPRSDRPFDIAGSFTDAAGNKSFSPNIRVPLRDMDDAQVELFNAIIGKGLRQQAMGASRIRILHEADTLAAGKIEGQSVFIETTKDISGDTFEEFIRRLPEGFEVSTDRVPNGYVIDINPRFGDKGPVGITDAELVPAFKSITESGYKAETLRHEYSSVYTEAVPTDPGTRGFDEIISVHQEGLKNGVIEELGTAFGWTEARARRFIEGRGLGKVTKDVRQKAGRIRAGYQGRLGDLDGAIQAAGKISEGVETKYVAWNQKAEKYLTPAEPPPTGGLPANPSLEPSASPHLSQTRINMRVNQMTFENDVRSGVITPDTPGVDAAEVRAILADQAGRELPLQ